MSLFGKKKYTLVKVKKKDIPAGLWSKCPECDSPTYKKELLNNLNVCPKCDYHFRIDAHSRLKMFFDDGQYTELNANLRSLDPLSFKDTKSYSDRLEHYLGRNASDAVVNGQGKLEGIELIISAMEFEFMGGSMGSVVGEKVTLLFERAAEERLPVVLLQASGGARMQEGILSLMQMAKTAAMLAKLAEENLPHVSILTHPTTGGVTASFASLGDVILAEPNALVGFAGPRVIRETINQELPEGFQRSEFLEEHGFVDRVVHRRDLGRILATILAFFGDAPMPAEGQRRRRDDH